MAKLLLVYSTIDGHTREICGRLEKQFAAAGHDVRLHELTSDSDPALADADAIVIGASIRYGKHRPEVARLINASQDVLEERPSAFFSVNAVARKPEKKTPETNPYVRKFLTTIDWKPGEIGIFGGRIDYPSYGFVDKHMIRLIMWITKGPTDPTGTFDFTDWDAVDDFGRRILDRIAAAA